jgi:hypothetical protein
LLWIALIAATGCGGGTNSLHRDAASSQPPILSAPIYSSTVARKDAEAVLAALPLPPKTARVAKPPPSTAKLLPRSRNTEIFARAQIQTAYWLTSERPEPLVAYIKSHHPEGAREGFATGYGGTGEPNGWSSVTFEVPIRAPLAGPRELFIQIAPAPNKRYAVRLDAIVAWHLQRPVYSLAPATATWLEATVTKRNLGLHALSRTIRRVVIADPSVVQRVAAAVNALPVAEPAGPSPQCPLESYPPPLLHLTFRASARSVVLATVVAIATVAECGRGGEATAKIRVGHHREVALTDHIGLVITREGTSVIERVEAALGHRLHLR